MESAINPGFTATVRTRRTSVKGGHVFRCPKCHAILLQAEADWVYERCRSCKRWVLLRRDDGVEKKEA